MTGKEAVRKLIMGLRKDWEEQWKPSKRVVLQLAIRSDGLRADIIRCLEDTRFDDVLISKPDPSSQPHPPPAWELTATKHPPGEDLPAGG